MGSRPWSCHSWAVAGRHRPGPCAPFAAGEVEAVATELGGPRGAGSRREATPWSLHPTGVAVPHQGRGRRVAGSAGLSGPVRVAEGRGAVLGAGPLSVLWLRFVARMLTTHRRAIRRAGARAGSGPARKAGWCPASRRGAALLRDRGGPLPAQARSGTWRRARVATLRHPRPAPSPCRPASDALEAVLGLAAAQRCSRRAVRRLICAPGERVTFVLHGRAGRGGRRLRGAMGLILTMPATDTGVTAIRTETCIGADRHMRPLNVYLPEWPGSGRWLSASARLSPLNCGVVGPGAYRPTPMWWGRCCRSPGSARMVPCRASAGGRSLPDDGG
jgi:hypothetical protein